MNCKPHTSLCQYTFFSAADLFTDFHSCSPVTQRPHRTRSASVNSDRYSFSAEAAAAATGGDSKSTPQLLGTMGESDNASVSLRKDKNPVAVTQR